MEFQGVECVLLVYLLLLLWSSATLTDRITNFGTEYCCPTEVPFWARVLQLYLRLAYHKLSRKWFMDVCISIVLGHFDIEIVLDVVVIFMGGI
jgi:hypothetical protein